jgi:Secretion system C-terminal sorting domain
MRRRIKPFLFLLLSLLSQIVYSQSISIVNLLPAPNQLVGDTVPVSVSVRSAYPIDSVSALVFYNSGTSTLAAETRLVYNPVTGFMTGRLILTGFPNIPLSISISMDDSLGNFQLSTPINIVHSSSIRMAAGIDPNILVSEPLAYSVARPALHVHAFPQTASPGCQLVLVLVNAQANPNTYTILGNYSDSIDTDIDFSAYQGMALSLVVSALDRNNRSGSSQPIPVFADTSPLLVEYFSASGNILDFNNNKLLVVDNGVISNPRIVDLSTGASTGIPFARYVSSGYLTPQGAVIGVTSPTGSYSDSLYDYNTGTLHYLGTFNKGSMKVNGGYAIWSKFSGNDPRLIPSDSLFLRNLTTGTNTLVAFNAAHKINGIFTVSDVTAAGLVAFADTNKNLVSYLNGVYTTQTNDGSNFTGSANPLTDGYNYAYTFVDETLFNPQVVGLIPQTLSLAFRGGHVPGPGTDYQVNNKYLAYVQKSDPTHSSLFLRDTLGNSVPVAASSFADLLAPNGDLMFDSASERELAIRNGQTLRVSSLLGRVFYRDSSWYIAIGRVLFALPGLSKPAKPSISGLDTAYCNNQGVQTIRIGNFPNATSGTQVGATLDAVAWPVNAADSSLSINVDTLSIGSHTLIVRFSNTIGTVSDTLSFVVHAASTPVVRLSANITHVVNLSDSVRLEATDSAGGGTHPLYTFATDRNFQHVLQNQSANNNLAIAPSTLVVGNNWIYVDMKTSASCSVVQNGVDSINIVRDLSTGIVDIDNPGQVIGIYPNPIKDQFTINGLSTAKKYSITLYGVNGQIVFSGEAKYQGSLNIVCGREPAGVYILGIYDETKNRILGNVKLIKE